MAAIDAPLLAADGSTGQIDKDLPPNGGIFAKRRRTFAVLACCVVGTGLYETCSYYRRSIVPEYFQSTYTGWGEAKCYKNTGGTCMFSDCNADRQADCVAHSCFCTNGCVGSDGKCRPEISQYKLVASNIRLQNAWWKDQYLYAPTLKFEEQLRTAKGKDSGYPDRWNIYEMPGNQWVPWGIYGSFTNTHGYMISPVQYPEFAAGISDTKLKAYIPIGSGGGSKGSHGSKGGHGGSDGGIIIPVGSMFIVSLYHLTSRYLLANRYPFDPAKLMNSLCRPDPEKYPDAIEINGKFGQASWYEHTGSWEVFGWVWSDPKEGGYWIPDPPLNISLPRCR